jgi:hypothetical protein
MVHTESTFNTIESQIPKHIKQITMSEIQKDSGLGLSVIERRGEMAIAAAAATAKATVEAKYVIALNNPRKLMESRASILDACKRPRFAESARYKKPVGKKQINGRWEPAFIEGLSIRFAETAIQAMKNITVESTTIWEDDEKRTVHVSVVDLESNLSYGEDITIAKTVERKKLKDGQEALATRKNSYGDEVFIVEATDDEVANKVAAQRSKVIRNCGLRLIPSDILEEAEEAILKTLESGGTDPKAEFKKIADAFGGLGVRPAELEKYLGHSLETITKKELNDLRAVFAAVRDGEASWNDYLADATVPKAEATPGPKPPVEALRKSKTAVATEPQAQTAKEVDKPLNVVPFNDPAAPAMAESKATIESMKSANPTQAAATPSAGAAAPSETSSAPTQSPTESTQPTNTPASPASKTATVEVPPSKLPQGWLPYLGTDNPAEVAKSLNEWMTAEGITEPELVKWAQGRNLLKEGQGVKDLIPAKTIGVLKARDRIRVAIIEGRD